MLHKHLIIGSHVFIESEVYHRIVSQYLRLTKALVKREVDLNKRRERQGMRTKRKKHEILHNN
jgi:hypothetical protein